LAVAAVRERLFQGVAADSETSICLWFHLGAHLPADDQRAVRRTARGIGDVRGRLMRVDSGGGMD